MSSTSRHDDFFVGYSSERSPRQRRFLLASALGVPVVALVLAVLLVRSAPLADPGVFEYGTTRRIEATVHDISGQFVLRDIAAADGQPLPFPARTALAVRLGKFGAKQDLAPLVGQRVAAGGTLIYAPAGAMLELSEPPSTVPENQRDVAIEPRQSSSLVLRGEIVDSKCFLGVMKPGRGPTHRACAVRCLSGGIPPALRVVQPDGRDRVFLLVHADTEDWSPRLLDLVGVPVEVRGEALQLDGLDVLRTRLDAIRRLEPRERP